MIWDYEIGFFKYFSKNKTEVNCINSYPINKVVENYIISQEYILIESENNKPKLKEGKIVVLI